MRVKPGSLNSIAGSNLSCEDDPLKPILPRPIARSTTTTSTENRPPVLHQSSSNSLLRTSPRKKCITKPAVSNVLGVKLLTDMPTLTAAVMDDGSYIVAPCHPNQRLSGCHEFAVFDKDQKRLGKYEATVIETVDSIALTWINKGLLTKGGATNFVLWYLTHHTDKPHIEVRNLLNEGLFNYLTKSGFSEIDDDETLQASCKEIALITQTELIRRQWILTP